jgi:hypothetical protein
MTPRNESPLKRGRREAPGGCQRLRLNHDNLLKASPSFPFVKGDSQKAFNP